MKLVSYWHDTAPVFSGAEQGPVEGHYDAATKRVFVFNEDTNNATVFDANSGMVVGTIPLGGRPASLPIPIRWAHRFYAVSASSTSPTRCAPSCGRCWDWLGDAMRSFLLAAETRLSS